ncbi:MAG: sulfurtransferase TusA family protein [Nannocystis sp.]|nr:sulfurtransferase TusA family protein [Nannocystis sp.]
MAPSKEGAFFYWFTLGCARASSPDDLPVEGWYGRGVDLVEARELDCRGLNCPMPIVRLSQLARKLPVGARIRITADDPAFRADLEAWVRRLGHTIVQVGDEAGGAVVAVVETR